MKSRIASVKEFINYSNIFDLITGIDTKIDIVKCCQILDQPLTDPLFDNVTRYIVLNGKEYHFSSTYLLMRKMNLDKKRVIRLIEELKGLNIVLSKVQEPTKGLSPISDYLIEHNKSIKKFDQRLQASQNNQTEEAMGYFDVKTMSELELNQCLNMYILPF